MSMLEEGRFKVEYTQAGSGTDLLLLHSLLTELTVFDRVRPVLAANRRVTCINLPGFGWIGFDPANACCPDARYLRIGSGLDAKEAAPIRGIARGAGPESMSVSVAVQAQAQ